MQIAPESFGTFEKGTPFSARLYAGLFCNLPVLCRFPPDPARFLPRKLVSVRAGHKADNTTTHNLCPPLFGRISNRRNDAVCLPIYAQLGKKVSPGQKKTARR